MNICALKIAMNIQYLIKHSKSVFSEHYFLKLLWRVHHLRASRTILPLECYQRVFLFTPHTHLLKDFISRLEPNVWHGELRDQDKGKEKRRRSRINSAETHWLQNHSCHMSIVKKWSEKAICWSSLIKALLKISALTYDEYYPTFSDAEQITIMRVCKT